MGANLDYNATLIERTDLSPALAILRVRPDQPPPEGRWFRPGQWLTMGLNNVAEPVKGSVRRAITIASAPEQREHLEFYIRRISAPASDNPFTHLLWRVAIGERLFLGPAPSGKFTIEDTVGADDGRMRVFVAAGTGLAPFRSMIVSALAHGGGAELSRCALLHGASYPDELGYLDHHDALARSHGLHYLPSVSRPHQSPGWNRATGRVEDFFISDRLEQLEDGLGLERGGFSPQNCVVFVCGGMGTIRNALERCLARGFTSDNRRIRRALEIPEDRPASIFYENYESEPPLNIKNPAEVERLKKMLPST